MASILHHLIEGNTLRFTSRLTGVHRTTIVLYMLKFGEACQRLMDDKLRNLALGHVQGDRSAVECRRLVRCGDGGLAVFS
jgi:hypothetical protein